MRAIKKNKNKNKKVALKKKSMGSERQMKNTKRPKIVSKKQKSNSNLREKTGKTPLPEHALLAEKISSTVLTNGLVICQLQAGFSFFHT